MTSPEAILSEEALERIGWFAAQASQPPVSVIQVPDDYDPVEWCQDALLRTVGERCYGVALGTAETVQGGVALMTAFTGNGSASLANANFYMLCHTAIPLLIEEIRRLRRKSDT
jgi:hypothetical protein